MKKLFKFDVKTLVATAIGAALFFVLSKFVYVPSPVPNTYICLQYGVQAFIAVLFGPIAGCLSGFIGHIIVDFVGGGVWISWELATAIFGFVVGLAGAKLRIAEGLFSTADAVLFNVAQVIAHAVAWILIAPVGDIVIYSEPADKVFLQGVVAAAANIVTTAIIGTLLCLVYAKARPKKGSLQKED